MKFIEVGVIFVPKVIHTYILVQGLGFGLGFTETLKFGFRFHQNQKSGFVRSLDIDHMDLGSIDQKPHKC